MDPISIKLGDDNYSTWKAEALGKIEERNLEKFFTETDFGGMPPMFSEEYSSWEEQDQVLYRWLLDSLSTKLLHQLERCKHALELWMEIEVYFLDKQIEELHKKYESLKEERFMLQLICMNLSLECPETSNEDKTIEEELIKEHGPESLADILSVKPGTSGSEMDPISIKLNDDNFSTWKAEALGKIKERNLEKFITMTDLGGRPPMFSEEYKSWKEQDQGLCRWLLSSLSTKLLHRLERCEYALELWMEIKVYFLDLEIEELTKQHNSNLEENAMLELMRSKTHANAEECPETSNENEAIEVKGGSAMQASEI
ncbi:hypothetical protein GmHk_07G019645 [Glycine max]|nr:hypothetical protein GmHk_07G019645 [Glycine max]